MRTLIAPDDRLGVRASTWPPARRLDVDAEQPRHATRRHPLRPRRCRRPRQLDRQQPRAHRHRRRPRARHPPGTRADRASSLALPGALYLYQGEELGLPEVFDMPDDRRQDPIFVRTDGAQLGPRRLPHPAAVDRRPGDVVRLLHAGATARTNRGCRSRRGGARTRSTAQLHDPSSMMSHYRDTIRCRRTIDPHHRCSGSTTTADGLLVVRRGDVVVALNPTGRLRSLAGGGDRSAGRSALCSVHGHDDASVVPADGCIWLVSSSST